MKLACIGMFAALAAGCGSQLDEATIEADFRNAMAADYTDVRVAQVTDVRVGASSPDGIVEGVVYFEGDCLDQVRCPDGSHMELLYQGDTSGHWRLLGSSVVTRSLPPFTTEPATR